MIRNEYAYKGSTPVRVGNKVQVLDPNKEYPPIDAKVMVVLASQFIWKANKNSGYCFYSDKGLTWRSI